MAVLTQEDILTILKMDLQISVTQYDVFLMKLIELAKAAITREGIVFETELTTEDGMLIQTYAAYLYRKRRGEDNGMPRSLRYALNNRLLSQKARSE